MCEFEMLYEVDLETLTMLLFGIMRLNESLDVLVGWFRKALVCYDFELWGLP